MDCDGSAVFVLFGCLGTHGAAIVSLSRYVCMYIILSQVYTANSLCMSLQYDAQNPMISN